jgi:hypothetical protein
MRSTTGRVTMPFRQIFILAFLLAAIAWPGANALAAPDTPRHAKAKRPHAAAQTSRIPRARADSCAQFGAGFVRMAGSDTCIQIGGAVDVGFGVGVGR